MIDPARDVFHLFRENNPRRLHAMSFSCLGKLAPADGPLLRRWKAAMEGILSEVYPLGDSEPAGASAPLVVGLSESGIVPSALFHRILREKGAVCERICSTRRRIDGIPFIESHSHGPHHVLPFPRARFGEICFVEDEITTGATLLELALALYGATGVAKMRFFCFADNRSPAQVRRFENRLRQAGIGFSLHVLLDQAPQYPLPPPVRPPDPLPCILAVGEAVEGAWEPVMQSSALSFQQVTLSPWRIDGKQILSRLEIGGRYYLYNPHLLNGPLYLHCHPHEARVGEQLKGLLAARGIKLRPLEGVN